MTGQKYLNLAIKNSCFTKKQISMMLGINSAEFNLWLKKPTAMQFLQILGCIGLSGVDYLNGSYISHIKFRRKDLKNLTEEDFKALGHINQLQDNLFNMCYLDELQRAGDKFRLNEETMYGSR